MTRWRGGVLPWAAAVAGLALLSALLLGGGNLNYDTQWALDWGQAIARGEVPDYDVDAAPTAHPLITLIAALSDPVAGDSTPVVLHAFAHLALGGLIVAAFAIALRLTGLVAGLVAATLLAVSPPILVNTTLAFHDAATAALILFALVLELRSPRRGVAPLVALAAAGLLRPEAWGLAIAYWLYLVPAKRGGERAWLAVLALAGPLLWMLSDLIITGEPLLSFTRTREGAEAAERVTGLLQGPGQLYENIGGVMRKPAMALAAVGFLLVAARMSRRDGPATAATDPRWRLPAALVVLLAGAFLALALGELSLLERYTLPLAAGLILLAGHAAGVFQRIDDRRGRLVWAGVAALGIAGCASVVPSHIDRARDEVRTARRIQAQVDALARLAEDPRTESALARCETDAVASYRVAPWLAYELHRKPGSLRIELDPARLPGSVVWIAPERPAAIKVFVVGDPPPPRPEGFRRATGNQHFGVYTRGC